MLIIRIGYIEFLFDLIHIVLENLKFDLDQLHGGFHVPGARIQTGYLIVVMDLRNLERGIRRRRAPDGAGHESEDSDNDRRDDEE